VLILAQALSKSSDFLICT
jgi:Protein of unknown function (DUF3565)